MENLTLTPATETDADAIWAVWDACAQSAETCWNHDYPTPAVLADDLKQHWLYAFRRNGEIIGSVSLPPADDIERQGYPFEPCGQAVMLTRLCITPSHWRQGYGGKLLRLAAQEAARRGAGGLHILCDMRNRAGLALFTAARYRLVCRATLYGDDFSVREKKLQRSPVCFDSAGSK
jgi:predicted N-acetyltransferase YhbS